MRGLSFWKEKHFGGTGKREREKESENAPSSEHMYETMQE